MNREILKQVIFDQHKIIQNAVIVDREYSFEPNGNYILTGVRRAGKSTMLYKIVKELVAGGVSWERIIYVNFEDERLIGFTVQDLNDLVVVQSELSEEKGFYFLDEVQNIEGWERFARRMADSGERVYITGSNAKMLSSEMETVLGGRYLSKYIEPYNFREYLTAKGVPFDAKALYASQTKGRIQGALREYMRYGGLPETLRFEDKRAYASSVFNKVLLGDIVARNQIRNERAMRLLIAKIAETVTDEVSYTKLRGVLQAAGAPISKDKVIDYAAYALEAYLLFTTRNFVKAFAEKEGMPRYYFTDNGFLNLFLIDKDAMLLENLVAVALRRAYGDGVYYAKDTQKAYDVDFFVPDTGLLVQAAFELNESSREREVKSLVKAMRSLRGVKRCLIVTMDQEEVIDLAAEGGETIGATQIEVVPLAKFLLGLKGDFEVSMHTLNAMDVAGQNLKSGDASEPIDLETAQKAFDRLRENAADVPEMTLDEINEEIHQARKAREVKKE